MPETRSATPLLVIFLDLTRFGAQSQRVDDVELADTIDAYYEQVGAAVQEAGGRVVKYVGDGVLVVFDEDHVDRGVEMLLALKDAVDHAMARRGWECRLIAKAHFGTAIAGPFGVAGDKRQDVIGKAVNTAAMLEATGVTLSVAAFRKLSPALRRRFRKHTPPVTYIRLEDPRRFRGLARV
jgi:class 3 adenylate cyclase